MKSVFRRSRRSPALLSCLALAGWHLVAGAQDMEFEPNDTWAAAQPIGNGPGSFSIDGIRSFLDPSADFFSFDVRGAGLLRIVASSPDGSADSVMGLYSSSGGLAVSNDDGIGNGTMSVIEYTVSSSEIGRFTVGFSGYDPSLLACTGSVTQCYDTDDDFVFDTFVPGGAGGSTGWNYTLSFTGVSLVPEPASALMLLPGLALLGLVRRRHRRSTRGNASPG